MPLSPPEVATSTTRSALSRESTVANRPQSSTVDLITSKGIPLPRARVNRTVFAFASWFFAGSGTGFFWAGGGEGEGCWLETGPDTPPQRIIRTREVDRCGPRMFRLHGKFTL